MIHPTTDHYWLLHGAVPASFLEASTLSQLPHLHRDQLALVNLEIRQGSIQSVQPAEEVIPKSSTPVLDLKGGQIWPCFVDMHTHLDKGHIWERFPNQDGSFESALFSADSDRRQHWRGEDLYPRIEFGLQCSYAHGTRAIRTHIDSLDGQEQITLEVLKHLQTAWQDRLLLQASALLPLELYLTPIGEKIADQFAEFPGGVLGGVPFRYEDLPAQLDRIMSLARERGMDLDFHTDENGNPESMALRQVADAALRNSFPGRITCGHCCSLSVQSPEVAQETIGRVKETNIGIVSLPMCNLFLQDRHSGQTPRWRGVTLVHELKAAGVAVAFASDNCRDPFYGFGDHDGLEVFTQACRIAHLDHPYSDWPTSVTTIPATLMGLSPGTIAANQPADLILFRGRTFSELLSRPQMDRVVLRKGKAIDTTLPDYRELDAVVGSPY
jgi:cytosine deaminase